MTAAPPDTSLIYQHRATVSQPVSETPTCRRPTPRRLSLVRSRWTLLLSALLIPLLVACEVPNPSSTERTSSRPLPSPSRTIRYGADAVHQGSVYLPARWKAQDRRPLVVYIHGGAWRFGSRLELDQSLRTLIDAGAVVLSLDYRLIRPVGEQVDDLLRGVVWAQQSAGELGIDPARTFLAGHSAGGHLALMLGLGATASQLPRPLAGIFALSAPVDLDPLVFDPDIYGVKVQALIAENNLCPAPQCAVETLATISPIGLLDPLDPPIYYLYGTADPLLGSGAIERWRARVVNLGMDRAVWFDAVEGAGHYPASGANAAYLRHFLALPAR